MFVVKSVYPKSCLSGYGVLILLLLMAVMAGCSSAPESGKFYSSDEGVKGTQQSSPDKMASIAPGKKPSSPSSVESSKSIGISKSAPGYSAADREVVLRYAEKGESDPANLERALKLVQKAEQLPSAKRTMEDYLILTSHAWLKEDANQAVQYANQGVMAKSDSARVKTYMFIYLGYTYESKSPTMARSYFNQAARLEPDFYRGHYESGRVLFLEKKYAEAQTPLEKALNLDPKSADIYGKLGQMFYGMDQYEEAAKSLEKALAMSPQTDWLHLQLGDTYFYGLKNREEGGRYYQQAVSKNGSDPKAHYGLALYYRYKNEYKKAVEHLEKATTLDYKNKRYQRELKAVSSEKFEIAKAVQKYQKAVERNPKDPHSVTQLGRFYQRWGKFEQAEEQFKKAVQLASVVKVLKPPVVDPESGNEVEPAVIEPSKVPEYANHLGWYYLSDRKYTEAEQAFKTALNVDPKNTESQFGLGQAYESLKQYDLAVSYYAQTVALDPKHEEAQKRLTDLKNSDKLMPVGEVIPTPEKKTVKKSVMKVKKSVMKTR
jgi:tetratricopeptide (TPR) repeat protein